MPSTEKTHAEYSGSTAHRWIACPGSHEACKAIPSTESPYAQEGTQAHALGEWAIKNHKPVAEAPEELRLASLEDEQAVQTYVDYCLKVAGNLTARQPYIEHTVSLKPILPDDLQGVDAGGIVDFACVDASTLHIHDYKHGKGYGVDLTDNDQMMFYAAGMLAWLNVNASVESKPRFVKLAIIQPRCRDVEPIQELTISVNDVWIWIREKLVPGLKAALDPKALRIAGEKQCRFCPYATCPEKAAWVAQQAQGDFSPIVKEGKAPACLPEDMTPERISRLITVWPMVEAWFKSIYGYATEQIKSGAKIPGLKLVRTNPHRKWKPEAEAFLVKLLGEGQIYSRELLSPAKIESLAAKMKADKADREKIAALSYKPQGELVVAVANDPREEVTAVVPVAQDFAADLLA